MGQAWCKEKTTKAQDSKSPLDRVFVRCAHRIYPGLKDEGSVLGGATQRVTSSEIGYAGSPPRHVLARGRSVDSVDRPFQPSDWVDVNLEVAPSTPRDSAVLTDVTVDTSLYPATPAGTFSNLKDPTPIPPPRRRRQRNKDRPLPPKPDEIVDEERVDRLKRVDTSEEPFYTSVKPLQESRVEQTSGKDVVDGHSGKIVLAKPGTEQARPEDRRTKEIYEHKVNGTGLIIPSDVVSGKRPGHRGNGVARTTDWSRRRRSQDAEEYERFARSRSEQDSSTPNRRGETQSRRDVEDSEVPGNPVTRAKNHSTTSLPCYDRLETNGTGHDDKDPDVTSRRRLARNSTGSLPAESFLTQSSKSHFEDSVIKDEVDEDGFVKYDPKKLEDWDFSDVSNCESNHRHRSFQSSPMSEIAGDNAPVDKQFRETDATDGNRGGESPRGGKVPASSAPEKPMAFGKTPMPVEIDSSASFARNLDDWIAGQNRYFDQPTLKETCKISPTCERKSSFPSAEPFFLVEHNQRTTTTDSTASGKPRSRLYERRLSNESEPFEESCEAKDLPRRSTSPRLVKAISEESLPREMLADGNDDPEDFFAEKLSKCARNELARDYRADPTPSPEPRIRPEILDTDHSILLRVLKDEADGSNLSSMTPSLNELEAALSDMLEKDVGEDVEVLADRPEVNRDVVGRLADGPIEPSIVPVAKSTDENLVDVKIDLSRDETVPKRRTVSFCAWEEFEPIERGLVEREDVPGSLQDSGNPRTVLDEPPEKPSRLYATGPADVQVPMPPRRKNRGSLSSTKDGRRTPQNDETNVQDDRLI